MARNGARLPREATGTKSMAQSEMAFLIPTQVHYIVCKVLYFKAYIVYLCTLGK